MGFLASANTITVTAKLTRNGREKLLKQSNIIFSDFILGDSDANYNTSGILRTGTILSNSGNLGENGGVNDNIAAGIDIDSKLYKDSGVVFTKSVEPNSNVIADTVISLGETIVSGTNLTYTILDRSDNTSSYTNLFKSLNLPITTNEVNRFTSLTSTDGGWLNTAFSGFGAERVLIGVINNDSYGELIDGKSIKCTLPIGTAFTPDGIVTGMTTYDIYSTFPKTSQFNRNDLNNQYEDLSTIASGLFGSEPNATYLVSDDIQRPNDDINLSWSTGYDTFKPFTINNKELININSVVSSGIISDEAVGYVCLDKGVVVFTHPTIVNNVVTNFSGDSSTGTLTNDLGLYYYTGGTYNTTVDSIVNNLVQNVVCIAGRGEFYRSENATIDNGFDDVRISEIAIVSNSDPNDVLAIGKIDRQVIKKKNDFVIFDVQIVI